MNTWKLFKRTMRTMGRRRFIYYAAILTMSITFAMFSVTEALLMKTVVDIALTGNWDRLMGTMFLIISIGIISLLCYRFATIRYNVEAKRIYGILYEKVLRHEMYLPSEYYENHHSGELLSKISFDLGKMGDIFGSRLRRVVMPFVEVIVFLVPMLIMGWQLTLCLVGINIVMIFVALLFTEPLSKASKRISKSNSILTQKITDLLQGIEQVKMYAAGKSTVIKFQDESEKYASVSDKRNLISSILECSNKGFDFICSLLFLAVGIFFVQKGYTSLGALAAIYTMYGSFSFQFLQMGKYLPELMSYLTYAQNIFDFLDEETEIQDEKVGNYKLSENSTEWAVEMENVDFAYKSQEKRVLNNFCMKVKTGEFLAITGPSGSGKSTISKLLLGFYSIDHGYIKLMNNDLSQMGHKQGQSLISYVPQDAFLFDMSIKENILMGKIDASDYEIQEATKMANAHDFIQSLPNGYDTQVGERGIQLSGGERQRVAIARAILKSSTILLMDEATSALDHESEKMVNIALQKLKGNITIIMIAHRTSTIQMADRVLHVE